VGALDLGRGPLEGGSRSKGTLRHGMIRAGRVEALGIMARQPAGASPAPRLGPRGPRTP
jgi:hypothetical protein